MRAGAAGNLVGWKRKAIVLFRRNMGGINVFTRALLRFAMLYIQSKPLGIQKEVYQLLHSLYVSISGVMLSLIRW